MIIKQTITYIIILILTICCSQNTSKQTTITNPEKKLDSIKKETPSNKRDSIHIVKNESSKIKQSKKPTIQKKPTLVEKFSIRDLGFTWEEIDACDCLFMVNTKNTIYKRLYFGRFKDNTNGIIQLEKKVNKHVIPILQPRSINRKSGSFWREIYQNDQYKIEVKASPTTAKVKGKYTYYINFTFNDLSSKRVIKKLVLANCKS